MKKPTLDFSGIVHPHASAGHLNGALIQIGGVDMVITARHLGMQSGQKVIISGRDYTVRTAWGVDIPCTGPAPAAQWRADRLLNGDITLAWLAEEVPPEVRRYELAGLTSGTGYMLRGNGAILRFPFLSHASYRNWLRGSYGGPLRFQAGDSGRPILTAGRRGETLLVSVLSRIWWGEFALLRSRLLNPNEP